LLCNSPVSLDFYEQLKKSAKDISTRFTLISDIAISYGKPG